MSFVDDLEGSIDIVDLVKRYTNLKKAGVNYKAVCPFPGHTEKTPSFIVSPTKQIAHCFGCRRGGGPIKFLMDVENCNFKEAVEILSNITGVKVKGFDSEKEKLRQNIYGLFKDIVQYYKTSLSRYPDVLKYLYERGLSKESLENFDFGYADSGVELYNYLREKGYQDELIEQSNVFLDIRSKKDKFIGRIIFPIRNTRGDIVGLAGRIIEHGEPKYLNSPASEIYDKSGILYGLFQAKSEIAKKDAIIITEGYMDTISLHQAGFKNVVCVSGTALTEKHIALIKKLTHKIYLCFDNDQAGANATGLSIEMLKNKDLEVKIISLDGGKDPDEIIKSGQDFQFFIENALSPIGYHLKSLQTTQSLNDKKEMLKKLLEIVKNYQDNVEKDYYLKEISKKLDIKLEVVYHEYNKTRLEKRDENTFTKKSGFSSEELLISYAIKWPEKIDFIRDHLFSLTYIGKDLQDILEQGVSVLGTFDLEKKNKYLSISQNDEALEIQAQIENVIVKNEEKIESDILKTIDRFHMDILKLLKEKLSQGDFSIMNDYNALLKIKK